MLTLALSLQLVATSGPPPSLHLLDRPPRAGMLLGQASVTAPIGREQELQRDIDDLNGRIRDLKTDWPLGAIIGAYFGFSAAAAIPVGLIITLIGVLAASAGGGILLIIGLIVTGVGVAGLVVGIMSVVSGGAAQEAAKRERGELVRQREALERELKGLRQGAQGVERLPATPPTMLTLAAF